MSMTAFFLISFIREQIFGLTAYYFSLNIITIS